MAARVSSFSSPVPAWEKRFCTSVCSIPWSKICYAKFLISDSMHKDIAAWDDSAALEAFHNAKARFLAEETNGTATSDFPLPDPDMYIDNVDYDAAIDPGLVADLENNQPPPPDGGSVIFAPDPLTLNNSSCSANWDDYVEKQQPMVVTGWGGDAEWPAATPNNTAIEPFSSGWDSKPDRGIDNGDSGDAWNNSWDNERNGSRRTRGNKNNNRSGLLRNGRKRDRSQLGFRSLKRHRVDNYQLNDNSHWLYHKQPLVPL